MADRRRRRSDESSQSESEASADETTEKIIPEKNKKELRKDSECLSEGESAAVVGEGEDSEYESAEEDQDEEDEEEEDEEEYDDEDSVIIEDEYGEELGEERQSGDGEEQPASTKELDDDEDRKNPAFVPRKGNFYEHDSRIGSEEVKEEGERPKKTLWKDEGKWLHDKFHDDMQAPKSKEEIIAMYGYDIRAYDKPPEAPRRFNSSREGGYRKRNTKLSDFVNEEDIPRQRRGAPRGRGGRGRGRGRGERRRPDEDSGWHEPRTYSDLQNNTHGRSNEFKNPPMPQRQWTNANFRKSNRDQNYDQERFDNENSNNNREPSPRKDYQDVQRPDMKIELKEDTRKVITQTDNRTTAVPSSEGAGGSDRKSYSRDRRFKGGPSQSKSQDTTGIEQGVEQLSVTDEQNKPKQGGTLQQHMTPLGNTQNKGNWSATGGRGGFPAPPKVDSSQNRPKRYSSQRQRNMPEAGFQEGSGEQGQQFYNTNPQGGFQPPSTQVGNIYPEQRAPLPRHPVPQHVVRPQVAYTIPGPTPQIQSPPRLLNPPVVTMATGISTQSLMQPALQPAFIQQGVVNFAAAPPPPPHYQIAGHIPLQGYPSPPAPPQPAPVPQQELYTAGGVTYYNPESQHQVTPRRSGTIYYNPEIQQQHTMNRSPVRRPKVPLPIIHPEELSKSAEGGELEQHEFDNTEYEEYSSVETESCEQPVEYVQLQQELQVLSKDMQEEKTSELDICQSVDDDKLSFEHENVQEQKEQVVESEAKTLETD